MLSALHPSPRPQPTGLFAQAAVSGRGAVVALSVRDGVVAGSNPAALTIKAASAKSAGIPTGNMPVSTAAAVSPKAEGTIVAIRAKRENATDRQTT